MQPLLCREITFYVTGFANVFFLTSLAFEVFLCLPIRVYCSELWLMTLLVYIFPHEFPYCYLKSMIFPLFSLAFLAYVYFFQKAISSPKKVFKKKYGKGRLGWNKRWAMIISLLIICRYKCFRQRRKCTVSKED